jgi:8-oxo-dGTP diphosphatase
MGLRLILTSPLVATDASVCYKQLLLKSQRILRVYLMHAILATLCYLEGKDGVLMLHRNKKKGDLHKGKWNGIGGKIDPGESPEESAVREVHEESGLIIEEMQLKGVLTFPAFDKDGRDWVVFTYYVPKFSGKLMEDCPEGDLAWIKREKLLDLPIWDGDRIFLPHVFTKGHFSGKFVYEDGQLVSHTFHHYA